MERWLYGSLSFFYSELLPVCRFVGLTGTSQIRHGRRYGASSCCRSPNRAVNPSAQIIVCSRQNYAFSRDGGLPFSSVIRRVNASTGTPVCAVWCAVLISALLGLLSFAGPSAIGAIFSLVVVGQFTAYSIPICARFLGQNSFTPGPFTLGRAVSIQSS